VLHPLDLMCWQDLNLLQTVVLAGHLLHASESLQRQFSSVPYTAAHPNISTDTPHNLFSRQ